ncbi:MAG: GNAT family N-acetyltransferase [Candidatus Bipolaricaulis sp.]|nr:GNAT family N-acetyltransferase [Candidatus Bipolaricaulis sp.]
MKASCTYELQTPNRDLLALFSALQPRQLHVESVLAGYSSGRVFVDRVEPPTAAVLMAGEGCYVGATSPTVAFLGAINSLLPRDRYTAVFLPPNLPTQALDALADGLYMRRAVRWHGRLETPPRAIDDRTDGIAVRPVDAEVLESNLVGVGDLRETILWEWKTLSLFQEFGFGSIAVADGRIVARSTSDYVVGDSCEIGVWVDDDDRLRGLGTAVATEAARQAFSHGLREVGWHCWANNIGSLGVAANVGFKPTGRYEILFNHWAAENVENMAPDEYRAFALDYERRFAERRPRESGYPYVVAATAWALAGEPEKSQENLRAAIDLGWLRSISQLRGLWPELVASARAWENPAWRDLFLRLEPE